MRVSWESRAWEDYLYWQNQDKKTLSKINILIKEMQRSPFDGQGKPELLRGNLTDYWSRRIDKANRIVYKVENDTLVIAACRGHYT